MKAILVSRCLLGDPCRYDGASRPCPAVEALRARYDLIPICPERDGGLPVPRVPCERRGDCVVSKDGRDLTAPYRLGAERALERAKESGANVAVLKSNSPSCGVGRIYDGTFSGNLTDGDGVTAELLKAAGIELYTESDIETLLSQNDAPGEN